MIVRRERLASLLLILFLLVLAGLTLFSNTFETALLPKVTAEKPARKTLSHRIQGSGVIEPRQREELVSESGWKVSKVHAASGELVKKDQLLITFNSSEAEQQLAEAEVQMSKMNLNREDLEERFIAAEKSGDADAIRQAKRDLELDRLDRELVRRKIEKIRKELALKSVLKAPYDGEVAGLQAKEGKIVPQGQSLLSLVQPSGGYQVSFTIDARLASLLQTGEKAAIEVKSQPPRRLEGTIAEIKETSRDSAGGGGGSAGMAGGGDGTSNGKAAEDNMFRTVIVNVTGEGLQGGEQANLSIERPAGQQGLVIRKELVKTDGTGRYVFVIRESKSSLGNTYNVRKAYITLGEDNGDEIIVLGGLTAADEIVAETSEPLQDGNRVRFH